MNAFNRVKISSVRKVVSQCHVLKCNNVHIVVGESGTLRSVRKYGVLVNKPQAVRVRVFVLFLDKLGVISAFYCTILYAGCCGINWLITL